MALAVLVLALLMIVAAAAVVAVGCDDSGLHHYLLLGPLLSDRHQLLPLDYYYSIHPFPNDALVVDDACPAQLGFAGLASPDAGLTGYYLVSEEVVV